MLKVALFINKLYGGGSEHAACNLSLALEKTCDVTLIPFDGKKSAYPHTEKTIDLAIPAVRHAWQRPFLFLRRWVPIRRIKRRERFDVTIAFLPGPTIANEFTRMKGEKTVMSVRNYTSLREGGRFSAWKTRFMASHADCVVAVSRLAALDLQRNFAIPAEKLRVIYNMVDPSALPWEYDPEAPMLQGNGPLVVTMGRLHGQKGHWHLLRAFAEVLKAVPDARLALLGDGEYMARLQDLAEKLGIAGHVFFPGFVVGPHGYVRRARLFVLTSLYEGMPNAMLEAMACGVPVVSADCPSGPREILAPDTSVTETAQKLERAKYGILTPPLDEGEFDAASPLVPAERALSEAMRLMLTDEALRGEYARLVARRAADFSPDAIADEWLAIVRSLAGKEG